MVEKRDLIEDTKSYPVVDLGAEIVEENLPVEEKAELVEVDKTEKVPSGVPQQQTNSNVPNGDGESGKLGLASKSVITTN